MAGATGGSILYLSNDIADKFKNVYNKETEKSKIKESLWYSQEHIHVIS